MEKVNVKPVEEQIKDLNDVIQRNLDAIEDRQRRIDEGFTDMDDCFISQRIEELSIDEAEMKINVLRSGGVLEFAAYFDSEGQELQHSFQPSKFSHWESVLVLRWPDGRKPVYQSLRVKDLEKCLSKKGITRGVAKHPAWVKLMSGGSGMYGAYMARAGYYEAAYNRATGEKNPRIKYED